MFILVGLFRICLLPRVDICSLRYLRVYYTFERLDSVRYIKDFVKSRLCPIHFSVTLAGLKSFVRFIDFVLKQFVNSRFYNDLNNILF